MRDEPARTSDELLPRVAAGDAAAFTALFRRWRGPVYRFALHMTGCPAAADDVTQEVFLAVMREAGRYEAGRSSEIAWLCGIARNCARRRLERQRPLVSVGGPDAENRVDVPVTSPDALDGLIETERLDALRRAIASLPVRYREVVVLCDLQELSYADASGALDCAIGTVRSRLFRARALLASKLRASALGAEAALDRQEAIRVVAGRKADARSVI